MRSSLIRHNGCLFGVVFGGRSGSRFGGSPPVGADGKIVLFAIISRANFRQSRSHSRWNANQKPSATGLRCSIPAGCPARSASFSIAARTVREERNRRAAISSLEAPVAEAARTRFSSSVKPRRWFSRNSPEDLDRFEPFVHSVLLEPACPPWGAGRACWATVTDSLIL